MDRTIGLHYRDIVNDFDKQDIDACKSLNFVENSPIEKFENIIKRLKNIDKYDHILVVSNSKKILPILKDKFRNKNFISYEPDNLERNSEEGMINSIVEFLLLSKTNLIIGSYYSSFSDEAAFFNLVSKITPINAELIKNIKDTIIKTISPTYFIFII